LSLKFKFYSLIFILHGALLTGAYAYLPDEKMVFFVVELFLALSLWLFFVLTKKIFAPLESIAIFQTILKEQEFSSRFSQTGNNELDGLLGSFNYMLDQLYAERHRLGDKQGMLQKLMDALPLSVMVLDYDDKLSQLNPAACKLFGLNENQPAFIDQPLRVIKHPLISQLESLELGQSKLLSDHQGKRYRCHRSRFTDRGFDRQFVIVQELTDELKSSEKKTYDKLIRVMSHEVNNTIAASSSVLRSCLYYSDQIESDERSDFETAIKVVIERSDNLNHFMQEYAKVVRLPEPTLESCNLYHLLLAHQRLLADQLTQANITLSLPQDGDQISNISADKKQMEQVLLNILHNAIESIGSDGQISVQFRGNQQGLTVKFIDSGAGITRDNQQDLFTPFFTTKAEGQGIGLMLTSEILNAHQFEFSLQNRIDRQGACFEIIFNMVGS